MDNILRSLLHALRSLERRPGFSITVMLTLALGVGVSSAVFSAIDTILLSPLPFPHSERVVEISQINNTSTETKVPPPRLDDWAHLGKGFEAISGAYVQDVSDTTGQLPEKIRQASVAPHFLEVFQLWPFIGRGLTDRDFVSGGVALISENYWRSRLAADPNVLSASIRIGGRALAIVGVMPRQFAFPDREVSIWVPVAADPKLMSRQFGWYAAIGRLKPGISPSQGEADLTRVQAALGETYPKSDRDIRVQAIPLKESIVGAAGGSLWLIFGSVSVLLVIACANIAGLLVSQMAEREQEVALQLALGASRMGVASRVLTEVALLVLAGSVLGVLVAAASIATIRVLGSDLPRVADLGIDTRILAFISATAVLVTLLCGLLPALTSTNLARSLQRGGRSQVGGRVTLPWVLVCIQVALSVALLDGAGLLLHSFSELVRVQPGFTPERVLSFRITGAYQETRDYPRLVRRIESTVATIAAISGVESVATASDIPGSVGGPEVEFNLQGHMAKIVAMSKAVSPGYFATLQIPCSAERCAMTPWRKEAAQAHRS